MYICYNGFLLEITVMECSLLSQFVYTCDSYELRRLNAAVFPQFIRTALICCLYFIDLIQVHVIFYICLPLDYILMPYHPYETYLTE